MTLLHLLGIQLVLEVYWRWRLYRFVKSLSTEETSPPIMVLPPLIAVALSTLVPSPTWLNSYPLDRFAIVFWTVVIFALHYLLQVVNWLIIRNLLPKESWLGSLGCTQTREAANPDTSGPNDPES